MALTGAAAVLAAGCAFGTYALHAQGQLLHPGDKPAAPFEVATIKANKNAADTYSFQLSPTGFKATHVPLRELVKFAYMIKSDQQLDGAPKWWTSEFFDIQAKQPEEMIEQAKPLPMDEQMNRLRLSVQTLLAERFQLKAKIEQRELPVYALVVAGSGMKMTEVKADARPDSGPPAAHQPSFQKTGDHQWKATAWPMKELTVWLSRFDEVNNHIVMDETGLAGHYDFVINGVAQRPPTETGAARQEPVVSIFRALPDQLGLKLEPRKARVEVLVVEHVEMPSEN